CRPFCVDFLLPCLVGAGGLAVALISRLPRRAELSFEVGSVRFEASSLVLQPPDVGGRGSAIRLGLLDLAFEVLDAGLGALPLLLCRAARGGVCRPFCVDFLLQRLVGAGGLALALISHLPRRAELSLEVGRVRFETSSLVLQSPDVGGRGSTG